MTTLYKLHLITGHYKDGTYGAEHIGNEVIGITDDPDSYDLQWDVDAGEYLDTVEVTCNAAGDFVVGGYAVATFREWLNPRAELIDSETMEILGEATPEQIAASYASDAGAAGHILIDSDGNVRKESDNEAVYGPLRSVFVQL
jgi:hypothetical protein